MLLALPAAGASPEEELGNALGTEKIEEQANLDEYGSLLKDFNVEQALKGIWKSIWKQGIPKEAFENALTVYLTLLLCSIVSPLAPGSSGNLCALLGNAAAALTFCGTEDGFLDRCSKALTEVQDMADIFLPTLGSAAMLSGQVTAAAVKYSAAALFLNVLIHISVKLILPLIRLFYAGAIAESFSNGGILSGFLGFLKWGITVLLTGIALCFTLYLSLTGLSAASADAAVVRSAKTAVSMLLPVVGSIASDAAGAILTAASVLRNAVGVFGAVAVISILAFPFCQIGVRYLLLKAVSALSAGLIDSRSGALLKRFSEGAAMCLGCLGTAALLLLFSVYTLCGVTISC